MSHLNSFKCFRYRTNLIKLYKNSITSTKAYTLRKSFSISYEKVITDELNLVAKSCCKLLPAFPVLFIKTIFDRDDRIFFAESCPVFNKLFSSIFCTSLRKLVVTFSFFRFPFRRSCIHSNSEIFVWFISSLLNGFKNSFDSFFIRL